MAMPAKDLLEICTLTNKCDELSMSDCSESNADDVVTKSNDVSGSSNETEDQDAESDSNEAAEVDQVTDDQRVEDQLEKQDESVELREAVAEKAMHTNNNRRGLAAVTTRKEVSNVASGGTRDVAAQPLFGFLMRVPRLGDDDQSVQEQIDLAKMQLDEKTRLRDSIQVQIQEKRANSHIHGLDYQFAKDEVRKARNLVKLIVKQLHAQSPDDLGSQEQRHVKILRNELQILKESIATATAAASEAEKKRDAQDLKIKQLIGKSRVANDARQAAFVHLQSLKNKLSAKNQPFFRYKDDAAAANRYARSGNEKALHRLCTNQVERVMQLWNANEEFRRDYVNSNARSTIRRFGTLDGRSLVPGENPPVLPSFPRKRVDVALKTPTAGDYSPKTRKEDEDPTQLSVVLKKLSEVELRNKAEEMLRMEEAEAKLKEERLSEELAKAEVAREMEQKSQAELQRKEAQDKEKERQKRLRKKENKKIKKNKAANTSEYTSAETTAQVKSDESTVSIPPSLINRKYRKLLSTVLISLFVYILFWLGKRLLPPVLKDCRSIVNESN